MIVGGLVILLLAIGYTHYVSPIVIQGEAFGNNVMLNATEMWNKLTGGDTSASVINSDYDTTVSCSLEGFMNGSCG